MFTTSATTGRFFAAICAVAISAVFMAAAIVPATPMGVLV